jgi:hypothetical protein
MAKKRIKDTAVPSVKKTRREANRIVRSEEKAIKGRERDIEKRRKEEEKRQRKIQSAQKSYNRKKDRYDKKVEKKVEDYNNTNWVDSEGNPFEPKKKTKDSFPSYESKLEEKERKKATRRNKGRKLGEAISNRVSEEANKAVDNLTVKVSGEEAGKPSSEQVESNVLSEGIDKSKDSKDIIDSKNKSKEVKNAIDASENEIDEKAQEEYDAVTEEIENRKSIKEVSKDGAGYSLPHKSSLSDLTDEELKALQGEIWKNAAKNKSSLPNAILEKIEHTDYYPPQQEFLQSTFTGARIGSQQIISAVPARIPMGLYDVRQKAMAQKAKDKKAALDKLSQINFETAEQFQTRLNDEGLDIVFGYVDLFDGDVEAMYRGDTKASQMFLKDLQRLEDMAKEITKVDADVDKIFTEIKVGDHYTPKHIVEDILSWQEGRQDIKSLVQDYKKGDSFLRKGRGVRNWNSFQKEAREVIKDLQTKGGWRQYVGKAQDLLDLSEEEFQKNYKTSKVEWAQNAQDAIYRAEKNSDDYESYRQTLVEFYPVAKMRELVEQMYKGNEFYEGSSDAEREEIIFDGVKYFMNQLPTVVETELSHQQNALADRMQAATARRRLEKDIESGLGLHEHLYSTLRGKTNNQTHDYYPDLKNIIATTSANSSERIEAVRKIYDRVGFTSSSGSTAKYGHMSGEIEGFDGDTYFDTQMDQVDVMYKGNLYYPDDLVDVLRSEKSGKTAAEQAVIDRQIAFLNQNQFEMVATEQRAYVQVADGGVLYPIEKYNGTSQDIHMSVDVMGKGVYVSGGTAANPIYSPTPFTFITDKDLESTSQQRRMDGKAESNYTHNTEYQKTVREIYSGSSGTP